MIIHLKKLPVQILPVDERKVLTAGHYKMIHAISYADAFAVADAKEQKGMVFV